MRLTARERQQLGRAIDRQWGLIRGNTLNALERKGLIERTSLGWRVTPLGHDTNRPSPSLAPGCTGKKSPAWDAVWLRRELEIMRKAALATERHCRLYVKRSVNAQLITRALSEADSARTHANHLKRILAGESLLDELKRKIASFKRSP